MSGNVRPATNGQITPWAYNDNYAAGANPWNGNATKVNPGSGNATTTGFLYGWLPGPANAPTQNYWQNRADGIIGYLDCIDVLNPVLGGQIGAVVPVATDGRHCSAYSYQTGDIGLFWVTGEVSGAEKLYNSPDGVNWTDVTASLPGGVGVKSSIAFSGHSGTGWLVGGDVAVYYSGSWGNHALPGLTPSATCVIQDAVNVASDYFLIGGSVVGAAPNPALWSGIAGTVTGLTITSASALTGHVYLLASGQPSGNVQHIALAALSSPVGIWAFSNTSGTYAGSWSDNGATGMVNPTGFAYGEQDQIFMAVEGAGANAGNVYTTVDGITWTLRSNITASNVRLTGGLNGLACRNGIWMSTVTLGGGQCYMVFSLDAGLTWTTVPLPTTTAGAFADIIATDTPASEQNLVSPWGQFMILTSPGGTLSSNLTQRTR